MIYIAIAAYILIGLITAVTTAIKITPYPEPEPDDILIGAVFGLFWPAILGYIFIFHLPIKGIIRLMSVRAK